MISVIVRKSPNRWLTIWQLVAHVGLCAAVLTLGFVAVDRSHVPLIFGLVVFGSVCWIVCWRWGNFDLKAVILYALLFRLALIGLPPSVSDDAYRYVWDGLVQQNDGNPYRLAPEDVIFSDLQQDITFKELNSKAYVSVYPPVSQLIFRLGTAWHTPDNLRSYYLIKGVLLLAELLAIFLLARIVSSGFVLLYAWSPVVLLETAGQAHTESAALLALILVISLARRGYGGWASSFLAIAGWVKLLPFLFFPFLWSRFGWRSVWPGGIVAVLLALLFAAPYVLNNVAGSLDLYARLFEFNAGPYYGMKAVMQWFTGEDWSKQIGPFLRLVFLVSLPVLYFVSARRRWPLAQAMLITTGFYLVLATTVHPWYLLIPLFLVASLQAYGWHWVWLGVCSAGTYLLYVGGPYWIFVIAGWLGWGILGAIRYAPKFLQGAMRWRAKQKFRKINPFFPRNSGILTVLDLGCAEGYVGKCIRDRLGARVLLADVVAMNRTELPHVLLQPGVLPWSNGHFDIILLYFVLHHAEDPEMLIREAMRVCTRRVIVVESVYTTPVQLKLLTVLDKLANRLRSYGRMNLQEGALRFRTSQEWSTLFQKCDARSIAEFKTGIGPFAGAGFVLEPHLTVRSNANIEK